VVDDDDEVRSYLEQELSTRYRVTACANGREALEILLAQPDAFSLVVSDYMMPEIDGIQFCMRIRSNVQLNHLPIILVTAKTSDEDRLASLEVGANAFISKPFNVEILLKTVQNLLEQQRRLRTTYSGTQNPADKVDTPELLSPDERLLQRVLKVINERLSDTSLTGEKVAEEVGLSRVHLYRKLKELTNQSPRNYIRNIRLIKAAELLSQKKMSIAEVAYKVGFASPDNFSALFKEMYGMPPKDYNEQHYSQSDP
jgi:DNA-binding response OmpR family regulator